MLISSSEKAAMAHTPQQSLHSGSGRHVLRQGENTCIRSPYHHFILYASAAQIKVTALFLTVNMTVLQLLMVAVNNCVYFFDLQLPVSGQSFLF
ncbi:MAG: hypothetical protein Q8M95_06190 [Candidatus Methanoperedens sp.]|nr:hypothetical protein [Candidatus Methanoperedens sp.]